MNVMKEAHKQTREFMRNNAIHGKCSFRYSEVLRAKLVKAHKEYKAMNKPKTLTVDQMFAINHFETCIANTLEVLKGVDCNVYFVAVENNKSTNDYTILEHKVKGNTSSPLGWATYHTALRVSKAQADEYTRAFPGTVALNAEQHLINTVDYFRKQVAEISK